MINVVTIMPNLYALLLSFLLKSSPWNDKFGCFFVGFGIQLQLKNNKEV